MENGLTIVVLCIFAWFWWDSRGVAEKAIDVARRKCQQTGLSFLNDTVAWKKIRLKRGQNGRMQLERTYFFEFASDMSQRYQGEIIMLGQQVTKLNLDAYRMS